jgi:transposase
MPCCHLFFTQSGATEVLSQWFLDRVKANGGRLKKPTIVALARKLLVALWKYVTSGVVIEGAIVRAA